MDNSRNSYRYSRPVDWAFDHIRLKAVLAVFLVLTGCASVDRNKESPIQAKGVELQASGVDAFASGDYARADRLLRDALRLDRSIDNRQAELLDLINIARVSIVRGDYDGARGWLVDAVFLATALKDDELLSESYATLAKADYMSGDVEAALKGIDTALSLDAQSGKKDGAKLNLKAAALIVVGRTAEADAVLKDALKLNIDAGDVLETANSYRATAEANMRSGSDEAALGYFQRAYDADRVAGNSNKLAHDLKAIFIIHEKLNRKTDAMLSLNRLYAVASASGRTTDAVFALEKLIVLNDGAGNSDAAAFYRKALNDISAGGLK